MKLPLCSVIIFLGVFISGSIPIKISAQSVKSDSWMQYESVEEGGFSKAILDSVENMYQQSPKIILALRLLLFSSSHPL